MKKLNVILFKNESENEKYSDAICQKLSLSNPSAEQEFCGIMTFIKVQNCWMNTKQEAESKAFN